MRQPNVVRKQAELQGLGCRGDHNGPLSTIFSSWRQILHQDAGLANLIMSCAGGKFEKSPLWKAAARSHGNSHPIPQIAFAM